MIHGGKIMKKICFAASSGGHLEEISRLGELAKNHDSFLVTERGDFQETKICDKVIHVSQINRKELLFPLKFIGLTIHSFLILWKEKPDCIVSTGALATFPICVWGKLMHKKIVYIESFARVDEPSLTGKLMYRFADLFIVQWKEMLDFFPNAVYAGGVF